MLQAENTILIVIDVQGKLAQVVKEAEERLREISILVRGVQALGIPVILTTQVPEKLGYSVAEVQALVPDEVEIPRTTFNVLAEPAVAERLAQCGRKQVLLCGYETHICLYQSASALLSAGYEPWLVTDAVSSRNNLDKDTALAESRAEGVHLVSVEMALFSMLGDAGHPAFREISRSIR